MDFARTKMEILYKDVAGDVEKLLTRAENLSKNGTLEKQVEEISLATAKLNQVINALGQARPAGAQAKSVAQPGPSDAALKKSAADAKSMIGAAAIFLAIACTGLGYAYAKMTSQEQASYELAALNDTRDMMRCSGGAIRDVGEQRWCYLGAGFKEKAWRVK